ncbi:MAG: hypothetical protein DRQ37_05855, partial [Gammaproteobacteria bacterium]
KAAGKRYQRRPRTWSAASKDVFYVVFRPPPRKPVVADNPNIRRPANDVTSAEGPGLEWLINAPTMRQVVLGQDGFGAELNVPDPRYFAVHKFFVGSGTRKTERDPEKRRRDLRQARAVAGLVREHLPQLDFYADDMQAIRPGLRDQFMEWLGAPAALALPPGLSP